MSGRKQILLAKMEGVIGGGGSSSGGSRSRSGSDTIRKVVDI